MLTVIEGPDGAGKSTLADQLAALYGRTTVLHQGPFESDPFHETLETLRPRLERGESVIWDRSHLGEQVYGPIFRDGDGLGSVNRRMLERWMLSYRAAVVLCYPPFGVALKNWERRHEREMFKDRFAEQYTAWKRIETELPVVGYDYRVQSAYELKNVLDRSRPPVNRGPGIGHFAGGVTLLVGDQVNTSGGPQLPFVGTTGCSPWLTSMLNKARIPERVLYWVNTRDPKGGWTDFSFLRDLRPERVVALGKTASERLSFLCVGHLTAPHPQYWKRFCHADPYPLIKLLREERS